MSGEPGAAPAFGPRAGRWLLLGGATSLLVAGVLAALADRFEPSSIAPDAFSRSALGHQAAVELWRALGHRVLVSRHASARKVGPQALLVLAEPRVGHDDGSADKLRAMLAASPRTLLVLPKRAGGPHALRPRWIGAQFLRPVDDAQAVLDAAGIAGTVVRSPSPPRWAGALPAPTLDVPQLVRSDALRPLLSGGDGVLLGVSSGRAGEVLVLSDPDVLATHGLGRGENALLAARLLDALGGPADALLVVDETLHGHEQQPSLVRELLAWPLVLATAQAALALLLCAWAALVRFGRPRPAPGGIAPGKAFLIENTADLLQLGGHGGAALEAYWRAAREHVARVLRAPGAPDEPLDAWLDRMAAARGRGDALAALRRRVAALAGRRGGHEVARAALAVHRFREEMTHGADPHP